MSGRIWDNWARAAQRALASSTVPDVRRDREELTRRAELAEAELARRIELDNARHREDIEWVLWADDIARLPRVRSALQSAEVYRAHIAHLLDHASAAKQPDPPPIAKHWAIMVDGAEMPLWENWQHDERAARLAWLDSGEFWRHIEAVLISAATDSDKLTQIRKAVQPFVVVADPAVAGPEEAET